MSSEQDLRDTQINLLLKGSSAFYASILIAILMLGVTWNNLHFTKFVLWAIILVIIAVYRAFIYQYFKANTDNKNAMKFFYPLFNIGLLLGGAIWGACGFLMEYAPSLNEKVFITLVTLGIWIGSVSSLSVNLSSFLIFILSSYTIYIVSQIYLGSYQIAIVSSIAFYVVITQGRAFNKNILDSFKMKNENYQLFKNAEASNNAKTEFLLKTSHELRTPLQSMLGYASLALKQVSDRDAKVISGHLKQIEASGIHLRELIDNLLSVANHETTKTKKNLTTFLLSELIEDVKNTIEPLLSTNTLNIEVISKTEYIDTDRTKLKQILINLLSNANKYTSDGNMTIRVEDDGKNIIFKVIDTGIGIPRKDINYIFNDFYQVHKNKATSALGMGVGLSIAKQYSKLLNGTIKVDSEEGIGATFIVTIPIGDITSTANMPESINSPYSEAINLRILLADDDNIIRTMFTHVLVSEGHTVLQAEDGTEAMELIKINNNIDLVIIDLQMPGLTGLEVISEMRHNLDSTIPVILLTADGSKKSTESAKRLNAELVVKPILPDDLIEKVNMLAGV